MSKEKKNRVGERYVSKFGGEFEIVKCRNAKDLDVYFIEYNCRVNHIQYNQVKRGNIVCPLFPSVCGIGYIGVGKYDAYSPIYKIWSNILERCYDESKRWKHITYKDCTICEEWHNFQNFAKWYEENYYECNGEEMALDKDILIKGNKIYSPQTCIFVPKRINTLFTKRQNDRGELPIGLHINNNNKIVARCNTLNERKYLGSFSLNEPFKAFTCYKNFKENYIKQVADEYKDLIPTELYEAMYRYEVEIDD